MKKYSSALAMAVLLATTHGARAEPCREYLPHSPSSREYDLTYANRYHAIASKGDYLFVCSRNEGSVPKFWCFQLSPYISQPPVHLHNTPLPTSTSRIVFSGDQAVLAMGFLGLGLVDISNPSSLQPVALTPTEDVCRDVALLGSDHVVTAEWTALKIYDMRDPALPDETAAITLSQARTVVVMDGYAYVACGNLGLAVVDVSNPVAPYFVTQLPVGGFVDQVAAENGRVYLTGYLLGLVTVDVTNPASPAVAWTLPLAGEAENVVTRDGFAYVPVGEAVIVGPGIPAFDAMALIRLNRPGAPALVDYYFTSQDYFTIALGEDRVFLGETHDSYATFHQAPLQCPATSHEPVPPPAGVVLSDPWPNPFNPRVGLSFTIPEGMAGRLGVYDLSGHLVAEIWRGSGPGGTVTATWDGMDRKGGFCPSGVYRFVLAGESGSRFAETRGTLLR